MAFHKNCNGMTRRNCLQLGLGAVLGGGLANILRMQARASNNVANPQAQADGCILIWMDGGPTHYETFDPKPQAPSEIRGEFQSIPTNIPGAHFSEHMTRLSTVADKLAIIRSIRHNQGNHGAGNHYMMTGTPPRIPVGCGAFVSFHPSLGSVAAHELGAPHGLPAYFSMPRMSRSGGPNFLGAQYAPFVVADDPNRSDFHVRDVALPPGLAQGHFDSRGDLRIGLDNLQRIQDEAAGDPAVALDQHYQQAFDLVTSPQAQAAFDISREPDQIRQRYGRNSFGQRALLARRLIEAGVPFVTLYEGGWDHHTNIFPSLRSRLPSFENTIATLIEDLDQRGKLEKTLVIALGEFGRTPQVNNRGGRDHWSNAMSVLVAGGGSPGGLVIGATDVRGFAAVERVLSPENFASTIYTKLGINPGRILYTPAGRPTHLVSDPTPIQELMG